MSDVTVESAPNLEQTRAIEEPGVVFVSAGAGTGKTTVIVERFCRAVCERGLDVDSILVITYTERAAGELRGRIRRRLVELGRHELARDLDARVDLDDPRLLPPAAAGLSVRGRDRPALPRAGRQPGARAPRRGLPRRARGVLRRRPGAAPAARGLRRPAAAADADRRARDAALVRPGAAARGPGRPAARGAPRGSSRRRARGRRRRPPALPRVAPGPESLLDLSDLARGEALVEARRAVERAALEALAARDREQLQELLLAYDRAYRAAKDRESALDFEDLQQLARSLLQEHEEIRERESWRFRSIMVDEFQDTNRLQCELIDLLAREDGELFFVGDEFQSIYRFRHADVEVFRERRDQVGGVLALTQNYRSRPEVLDVINELFAADFGDTFQPLNAAGRFADPAFGPAVELLVTDKDTYKGTGTHWREAEARHIAARVRDIVDSGEATPGEIVLLFAAGHRRAAVRGGAARDRAADLPRDRPRLLPPAAGGRPARLPAAAAQPLRRRGAGHRSGLAVRRRLERCARAPAPRRAEAAALRRDREGDRRADAARRAALPGVQAALRPARRAGVVLDARAPLRADRLRARLRPGRARAVGRSPPLREPAQARAAGAVVRGAARAGRRGLRPLRRRAGRGRRARSSRRPRRRRAPT